MIRANKQPLFSHLFDVFNQFFLKINFKNISIKVDQSQLTDKPLFIMMNHSTWWDALLVFHLHRRLLKQESYIMMHEEGIKQYRFFNWLGAYSVNRNNPKDIMQSLKYTVELMKQGKTVWMFPQGDEFHQDIRPLNFLTGAAYCLEKVPEMNILPIAFYYSFGRTPKREVYIHIGKTFTYEEVSGMNREEKNGHLEKSFTKQLNELRHAVIHNSFQGDKNLL